MIGSRGAGRRGYWVLFLLAGGCTAESPAPPPTLPEGEGLFPVDGAELFVRTVGEGEPILVLHGGPGMEHSYLLPGLPEVVPGRRLVFFDRRGTGRSEGAVDSSTVSLDAFLGDIDAIRAALGRPSVDVLAHSFGGFLAVRYAHAHPEAVGRLILLASVEPGFRHADASQERRQQRRLLEDQRALDSLTSSPAFQARDPATVNEVYRIAFLPSFADRGVAERLRIEFTARTAANGGRVAQFLMGPVGRYDDYDLLADIQAPTLILHGAEDLLPVAAAQDMEEALPNGRLVVVQGAGHFPWLEQPDATRTALAEFLQDGGP